MRYRREQSTRAQADSIIGVDDAEDDYLPLVPSIFSSGLMPGSSSAGEGEGLEAVVVGAVGV